MNMRRQICDVKKYLHDKLKAYNINIYIYIYIYICIHVSVYASLCIFRMRAQEAHFYLRVSKIFCSSIERVDIKERQILLSFYQYASRSPDVKY